MAANTKVTQDWWNTRRDAFTIYASELVEDEAARGDKEIANQRLDLLKSIMYFDITELAQEFLQRSNLPSKAANDSLHIALATVYGLDYLITWNCKHMVNAQIQKKLCTKTKFWKKFTNIEKNMLNLLTTISMLYSEI